MYYNTYAQQGCEPCGTPAYPQCYMYPYYPTPQQQAPTTQVSPAQQFQQQPQQVVPPNANGSMIPGGPLPVVEESYVENILRFNRGKVGTFYMTYENNSEWNAKVFRGVIETAGRDHIIISDPQTGMRYLLLTLNLNYVTFDEEINYIPPVNPFARTR
ncbi:MULTISPECIES: spore coat protein GerQ [Brevibacillus]|uniref:spore coat protein GerQ n=1 Tax=Brevibacillus TaxID=55080 RepID=UPI000B9C202A|nr:MULTISPECIES: spore coat protein GerQ [Brevibacillus]MCG7316255.1 spore coat protein GerQ [Brevibacillus laterosporus]MED1787312.1 spore coat protein GerQ [Brevibacillus laterosporus]RFB38431.1 spore coat protein GerQ [Brevibacillus sp. VP]